MEIEIHELESGYLRAQGTGPCEWAQWPKDRKPLESDFFPEASTRFRIALAAYFDKQEAELAARQKGKQS